MAFTHFLMKISRLNGVLNRYSRLFQFGVFLAGVYLLLHWLEFFVQIRYADFGLLGGAIALIFSLLGIWFGRNLSSSPVEIPSVQPLVLPQIRDYYSNSGPLSPREMEVLSLLADGKSNQEIADALFVSTNTIKTHVARLYEKLEVRRRTEAVLRARQLGILEKIS